jgi:isopentenyl diphosphate isomerase/L-lactate dehydrogenase-like FMN-dependent dehydrogenase
MGTRCAPNADWAYVRRIVDSTHLPVMIKGVLTAGDARAAAEAGVRGVIVSNHGGRQLDSVPVLLQILAALQLG